LSAVLLPLLLTACSSPQKLSEAQLAERGLGPGTPHWEATAQLRRLGYACSVSGPTRAQFDCSRTTGLLITCVLRVTFTVDDQNLISTLRVSEPACLGTP